MSQFHPLLVTDIHHTIRDAVVLTLKPEDPGAFAFTQGQYLTFRRDFDGTELRRSYSIWRLIRSRRRIWAPIPLTRTWSTIVSAACAPWSIRMPRRRKPLRIRSLVSKPSVASMPCRPAATSLTRRRREKPPSWRKFPGIDETIPAGAAILNAVTGIDKIGGPLR